jgi:hypothetical protein
MFIPLISLFVGACLVYLTYSIFRGYSPFRKIPALACLKGEIKFLSAGYLIAIALGIGVLGYFGLIEGGPLRSLRFILGVTGFALIGITYAEKYWHRSLVNLESSLKLFALILVSALFLKSLIFVDQSGDTWMYHLPFAARFWGLITEEHYLFEYEREHIYQGFPLLANMVQGFFWKLFGLYNPQGVNLASFLSLVVYLVFLKTHLKIPFYLSALALLAVPLLHIAATAGYVDLFGNVWFSIAIILTYLFYVRRESLNPRNFLLLVLSAAGAANTKFLLVPPLILVLGLASLRILVWVWQTFKARWQALVVAIAAMAVSSLMIFATEVKNTIVFGNPFYPLRVAIAGITLNHTIVPSADYIAPELKTMFPLQRWVFSLLEIGAFNRQRPWPWTIAMDFVPLEDKTFGMGGYLGIYVVLNVALFIFLSWQMIKQKETKGAIITVLLMTIITPFLSFSYQLRYYFYWIMVLISLNLFLLLSYQLKPSSIRWISTKVYGLIALALIVYFCAVTRWDYTKPRYNSLNKFIDHAVKPEIIQQIKDGDEVCLVGFSPHTFLYNSKFHPNQNYTVKSEYFDTTYCGSRKIIQYKP